MKQKKVHKKSKKTVISKLKENNTYIILGVIALSLVLFAITQNLSGKTQESKQDTTSNESTQENDTNQEKVLENKILEEEKGETTSESDLALPTNFPQDFPNYPNAEITSTSSDGKTTVVELETQDSLQTVTEYYETKLKQNSWEVTSTAEISNAAVFEISKKNLYGALIISYIEGKTKILIDVGPFPDGSL